MCGLSQNPNITPEFVKKHIDKPWDWNTLSMTIKDLKFVKDNPELPWVWGQKGLSMNPIVTPDFVESEGQISEGHDSEGHNLKSWHWGILGFSSNPSVTPKFIEDHIKEKWNWSILSRNRNLTYEFVKKYHKRFFWGGELSDNPLN